MSTNALYIKLADNSFVPVGIANPLPIYNSVLSSSYTNKSGTITLGGTAQTLAAANTSRRGLIVQNLSSGDLWISPFGTAAASQPSLKIAVGAYWEMPINMITSAAISIFGATTAQAFTAWEA